MRLGYLAAAWSLVYAGVLAAEPAGAIPPPVAVVLGVPCNQFGGQEPGTSEEIAEFCSLTYGVTFPMTEKVDVNGDGRHPLYESLVDTADADGHTGDIRWNFEKFLVAPGGQVTARFSPQVAPEDPALVAAVESTLTR